jgi:FkbM family methyltransferase
MLTKLLWWARFLRALWHTHDASWSRVIANLGISPTLFRPGQEAGTILVRELNLVVTRSRHQFIIERLRYLLALRDRAGAAFSMNEGGELVVTMGQLRVIVRTRDNLGVLHEVFVEQIYNIRSAAPCVVWDIGMNVGYASLYFSMRPEVVAVYGYEPFPDTFAACLQNIALNPTAAAVITAVNAGVSDASTVVCREDSAQYQGRMSTLPERPSAVPRDTVMREEQVALEGATDILASIVEAHPGVDVYAKIDCEGSEYAILSSLLQARKLRSIKAFAIEWHDGDPGELTRQLTGAGFSSIEIHHPGGRYGSIYAFRADEARARKESDGSGASAA